jgi:RimJ/RimL family protein N-acetyltransferase
MHAIEETTVTRDGELLHVRRLGACDRDAIAEVFARMSPQSRHMRFLSPKPVLTEAELRYLTDLNHTSHDALAAVAPDGRIVAVARYAEWTPGHAELAIEVVDEYQGRGIGAQLLERTIELARANGYCRLTASILWENLRARTLFKRLCFRATGSAGGVVDVARVLCPATVVAA